MSKQVYHHIHGFVSLTNRSRYANKPGCVAFGLLPSMHAFRTDLYLQHQDVCMESTVCACTVTLNNMSNSKASSLCPGPMICDPDFWLKLPLVEKGVHVHCFAIVVVARHHFLLVTSRKAHHRFHQVLHFVFFFSCR